VAVNDGVVDGLSSGSNPAFVLSGPGDGSGVWSTSPTLAAPGPATKLAGFEALMARLEDPVRQQQPSL
jgi:hypothetical protein